jgi:hypothetical protein
VSGIRKRSSWLLTCLTLVAGLVRLSKRVSRIQPESTRSEDASASRPCSDVALQEGSELIRSRRHLFAAAANEVKKAMPADIRLRI